MPAPFQYYTQFQSARGSLSVLPSWARSILMVFALPGIILILLSIAALLVSILALLLLTVPVYRVLQAIAGVRQPAMVTVGTENPFVSSLFGTPIFGQPASDGNAPIDAPSPGRKQVDAKVTDAD